MARRGTMCQPPPEATPWGATEPQSKQVAADCPGDSFYESALGLVGDVGLDVNT